MHDYEYDPEVLDEAATFGPDEATEDYDGDNRRIPYNAPYSAIDDPWWDSDTEGY